MGELYIAFAVPVFVLLIALEALVSRARGVPVLRIEDAVTNLSCGIGQQLVGLFTKALAFGVYVLAFEQAALFELSSGAWWVWGLGIVLVDLCYYWFHRSAHRVNVLWTAHAVHHQSEDYNLSVALRQAWLSNCVAWVFYLPCALVGIPPLVFALCNLGITLYQFWIHTETIRTLGPIEWVFNTPSHHRVHHGINPRCIDTNYAGLFIVWDRLFGTFVREEGPVVYGTVKPLASWNPWWANLEYWVHIVRLARRCPRWIDRLRAPFMPPEWRPAELGGNVRIPEITRAKQKKYAAAASRGLTAYVVVQFLVTLSGCTVLLAVHTSLARPVFLGVVAVAMLGLLSFGGLFERRAWALALEVVRLAALAAGGLYVASTVGVGVGVSVGAAALGSGAWLLIATRRPALATAEAPPEPAVAA